MSLHQIPTPSTFVPPIPLMELQIWVLEVFDGILSVLLVDILKTGNDFFLLHENNFQNNNFLFCNLFWQVIGWWAILSNTSIFFPTWKWCQTSNCTSAHGSGGNNKLFIVNMAYLSQNLKSKFLFWYGDKHCLFRKY